MCRPRLSFLALTRYLNEEVSARQNRACRSLGTAHACKSLFLEKKSMFRLALKLTLLFSRPLVKGANSRMYYERYFEQLSLTIFKYVTAM